MSLRDEARNALRVYQSRTGMPFVTLAAHLGYAHRTVLQFVSGARYGDGEGDLTAAHILEFIAQNPPPTPELPGKLYPTANVREIDAMLRYCRGGRWGVLYGPAGCGKTYVLEYRAAEAYQQTPQPEIVYIVASPGISPTVLLKRIAAGLAAPFAFHAEGLRENILWTLRRRQAPVALAIDEAQNLGTRIDTLETLREIGDRGRMGILIVGHDQVFQIFAPRQGMYFEQWRSRIQQKERRLLGLSEEEARSIVAGELGRLQEQTIKDSIETSTVQDPKSGKSYISPRRLSNAIKDFRELREKRGGRVN